MHAPPIHCDPFTSNEQTMSLMQRLKIHRKQEQFYTSVTVYMITLDL